VSEYIISPPPSERGRIEPECKSPLVEEKEEGPAGGTQQALVNQEEMVAGVRFELTTFGL
jgi:hypothetical protein